MWLPGMKVWRSGYVVCGMWYVASWSESVEIRVCGVWYVASWSESVVVGYVVRGFLK